MAVFPKIQSPCPYKSDLAAMMDGDFCRMCKRQVVDLTAWSDDQRVAFLSGCEEEVCVSYRLPLRPAIAAAALAVAAMGMPTAAAAQDEDESMIVVGGIKSPTHAQYIETAEDKARPDLPIVYEDEPQKPAAKTAVKDRKVTPPAAS